VFQDGSVATTPSGSSPRAGQQPQSRAAIPRHKRAHARLSRKAGQHAPQPAPFRDALCLGHPHGVKTRARPTTRVPARPPLPQRQPILSRTNARTSSARGSETPASASVRAPHSNTHCPQPFPSQQFQALFNSLFKVLFIFPSQYLFAIGLLPVFSLGWNLPPTWICIPEQIDSKKARRTHTVHPPSRGYHPFQRPLPRDLRRDRR